MKYDFTKYNGIIPDNLRFVLIHWYKYSDGSKDRIYEIII